MPHLLMVGPRSREAITRTGGSGRTKCLALGCDDSARVRPQGGRVRIVPATVAGMARVPRSALADGHFHVVARGVCESPIFRNDRDRVGFVELLRTCQRKHRWTFHAYCLMDTHYHLVVAARRVALSRGLCELNGIHARRFNRHHGRYGHLFAERFTARRIESDEYLYEACSYVLLNPVKAGLCERVDQWPWSFSRYGLASS